MRLTTFESALVESQDEQSKCLCCRLAVDPLCPSVLSASSHFVGRALVLAPDFVAVAAPPPPQPWNCFRHLSIHVQIWTSAPKRGMLRESVAKSGTKRSRWGASIHNIRKIFGFLVPLTPSSALGGDLYYKIHGTPP